jgi:hypothetical protein
VEAWAAADAAGIQAGSTTASCSARARRDGGSSQAYCAERGPRRAGLARLEPESRVKVSGRDAGIALRYGWGELPAWLG